LASPIPGVVSPADNAETTPGPHQQRISRRIRLWQPLENAESASLRPIEDYTNKYKGEQVELALFGGEYQEGVLTAYCSIEDVPHVELNGHILVPLQNVASLHCSSRCDAPEPDWPPRGLDGEDDDRVE
jgi:hypothetical protein